MTRVLKSLGSRLIALILIAMLPMLAIVWYIGMQLYQHAINDVHRDSNLLAQGISLEQEKHIVAAQQLLIGLSTSPAMIERRPGFCSVFRELLAGQDIYANAGMTDVAGNVICSAVPKVHPVSFSDRIWYREVRKGNKTVVGDYHLGVMMQEPVVIVARPVLGKANQHLAYLFLSVDLSWFDRRTLEGKLPEGAELIFYDHHGSILHREPEPEKWRGRPVAAAIKRIGEPDPKTGVVEAYGGDGVLRLFSYAKLEGSAADDNALIAVGIPADSALAQTRRIGGMAVLLVMGVFGGLLLFAWLGTRRLVVAPVQQLIRLANAHAAGDLSQRSGLESDTELGELAHALDDMAEMLADRNYELTQHLNAFNEHAIVSAADTAGNIIYVNDRFCKINQYTREEVIGQNHRLLSSGFHPPRFFAEMWETISRGEVWRGNIRNRRKDGSHYWVASTIVPFLDEKGRPRRYLSMRTDITHALAADEALQKSEARFRLLAENAQDVISLRDLDGRYIYASPSCGRVLGYAPEELVGHVGYDLVHPGDIETVREKLHQPALRGEPGYCEYFRLRCRNGNYIWVEATAVPAKDESGRIASIQVSTRDVSARKRVEDVLRLHDRALAASGSGIVIFRRNDCGIEYANAAYSDMVGLPEEELPGQRWPAFAEAAGSAAGWRSLHDAVVSGAETHVVVEAISRQKRHVWCNLSLSPVPGEDGVITHYVASITNVSERVAMEIALMRAKEEAEQASRAKSKFLSHVSHELRTPLNAILGFAQLLKADTQAPLSETQRNGVERILGGGWLLRDLIDDLLELSRLEVGRLELKPSDVNVSDLLRECLEMTALQAAEKHLKVVNLSGGCDLGMVRVDAKCLKQVVLNLLSNAVKYNRDGGRVAVFCHQPNDHAMCITVSDSGIGIPLERRDELFQYFSRLGAEKTGIPGVGVGLALCWHLMKLMGGNISLESVPGKGSSFTIEFPVTRSLSEKVRDVAPGGCGDHVDADSIT